MSEKNWIDAIEGEVREKSFKDEAKRRTALSPNDAGITRIWARALEIADFLIAMDSSEAIIFREGGVHITDASLSGLTGDVRELFTFNIQGD